MFRPALACSPIRTVKPEPGSGSCDPDSNQDSFGGTRTIVGRFFFYEEPFQSLSLFCLVRSRLAGLSVGLQISEQ
jgi:hypothetical protein